MNYPKVSIIILNWNGKQYLGDCLDSVFNQSYENFEVILVDNGSTDGSLEFAMNNFLDLKVIAHDKNYGFAKGNNIGIEEALKGKDVKYIALLNNDTKVEPDWLKELVEVAGSDEQVGSCQPKMLSWVNPKMIDALGISITKNGGAIQDSYGTEDTEQYNQVKEVFGACAGAALYKREMLSQIGLFDEDFFAYYEDVDLALRARLAGWRCMYVPKAVVYHRHSATVGRTSPFKLYFLERNRYYYIIKNLPIDIVLKFLIRKPIAIVVTILRHIKHKKFRLLGRYLKANFDGVKNITKMLKKRRKILSARFTQDEELKKWFR